MFAVAKYHPLHKLITATVAQFIYLKYSSFQFEKHNATYPRRTNSMTESKG